MGLSSSSVEFSSAPDEELDANQYVDANITLFHTDIDYQGNFL